MTTALAADAVTERLGMAWGGPIQSAGALQALRSRQVSEAILALVDVQAREAIVSYTRSLPSADPIRSAQQVIPWWLRGTPTAYTSLLEGSSYRKRVGRMTDAERDRRWTIAKEHLRAAQLCFDHGLYSASASRSYYAA